MPATDVSSLPGPLTAGSPGVQVFLAILSGFLACFYLLFLWSLGVQQGSYWTLHCHTIPAHLLPASGGRRSDQALLDHGRPDAASIDLGDDAQDLQSNSGASRLDEARRFARDALRGAARHEHEAWQGRKRSCFSSAERQELSAHVREARMWWSVACFLLSAANMIALFVVVHAVWPEGDLLVRFVQSSVALVWLVLTGFVLAVVAQAAVLRILIWVCSPKR